MREDLGERGHERDHAAQADHEKFKKLFREYEGAGEHAAKKRMAIAEKVFQEIEVHSMLEQQIFYPAVQGMPDDEVQESVREAKQAHNQVAGIIEELQVIDPKDEEFDRRFRELIDKVEDHIDEEEGELIPEAERLLSEDLETLGLEMAELKKQLGATLATVSGGRAS